MTEEVPTVVDQRRAICAACPHRNPFGICSQCGCVVFFKTMIMSSNCPIHRWGPNKSE